MPTPQEDIVILSLFRSDSAYSSTSLSLANAIAKTGRVFYVNHPFSLKDLLQRGSWESFWRLFTGKNRYEQPSSNLVFVHSACTLPINWLPHGFLYRMGQGINNAIVTRCIRRMKKDFQIGSFLYLNCYDPFFLGTLPKGLGARKCIYQCVDDITQDAYTHKHGTRLEAAAIGRADLTLTTSSKLLQLRAPLAKRIAVLHNAADSSTFLRAHRERFPRPVALAGHIGKVIGFFGNFDAQRIDYTLLMAISKHFSEHCLLLIGPVNCSTPTELGLDRQPNVRFIGPVPLNALPPYLQHIDVALIPFACNTLTESIYPLKINEYLAAGKPVVSTAFSIDIRQFSEHIYLAENHEDFLAKIKAALLENDPERVQKRIDLALSNSWEARAKQFWDLVRADGSAPQNLHA
jgi:teichuronic acid biosynthesis glycosyltransferase TuaH